MGPYFYPQLEYYRGPNNCLCYFGGSFVMFVVEWAPNPILIIKAPIHCLLCHSDRSKSGATAKMRDTLGTFLDPSMQHAV